MPDHTDSRRIALWQCESHPQQVEDNLARLDATAGAAADRGAQLLIAPEMTITGYAIGPEAADLLAEPPDGPVAQRVRDIARRHGIAILYGCVERAGDGRRYNAIRLVDRHGTALATHHKTQLFGDLDRHMVAPGSTRPPVVEWSGWRVGLLTCYEVEFPELVRSCAVRGADLICVPTANMIEYDVVPDVLLPARALESQVYIAYANYSGAENDLVYGGRSTVVAPTSAILARADRTPELIVVDLDRGVLDQSRENYPYLRDLRTDVC
ncbi:carbon-nitrogen hydrolase [Gordonia sp. HNM0687]|uniref:Carbon-nitrogen hydrolase n=1 Tax=Gordonia mangrovi TaxID=2665643 RepID=A0A6L7GNS6_9ACTN|nr:carbon-nitrogen hydrolase family protein [Gordonia mangrovi]MXP20365.1 carbon-nitrogen hydrolase [Gordonia mangrovi]UVF79035.1 carbon-nitrogen hydrolase family protein [Gordonia mangrovi]